jgi:hypothetical protein
MGNVLEELLVAIGMDSSGVAEGADEAAGSVEKSFAGISTAAAGAAVGGLFIAGLDSAMDLSAVEATMQRQLGLTAEEADRAGQIAGDVYSAGFGDSMEGVGEAVSQVVSQLGSFSDMTNADLIAVTEQAQALSDTFEFDVGDSAKMASQMVAQGLAGDATEAFDVLTKAAQTLPKAMLDDLPSIVSEYGTHFQRIGLDGKTAFGMMSQFVQAGGKDLDQAGDVLHEFARITTEETDRAKDGFKGLGLNGAKMLAEIHKGGPEAAAALGTTITALRGVEDPAKRAQLEVALFGDMAGESADALLAMNPQTALAATGMDDTAGAAQGLVDSMKASPAQQWDSVMRTLTTTLGEALLPVLDAVSSFLKDNPGLISAVTPVVLVLAAALAVWAAVQWVLNSALLANPITWIILGVVALIAIIVLIATKTTWFQTAWHAMSDAIVTAWNWVWTKLQQGFALLTDLFLNFTGPGLIIKHWDTIKSAVGSAMTWVSNTVHSGIDAVSHWIDTLASIPGKVGRWFSDIGGKIAAPFKIGFASVANFWNRSIGGFSFSIPSWVPVVGGKSWSIPNIPMLADGGIIPATPGGMLALVGEGRQDEAVMPLDRLDSMMRSVAGAVARTGGDGGVTTRVVLDVTGADSEFKTLIKNMVRTAGRGDVQIAFGQ